MADVSANRVIDHQAVLAWAASLSTAQRQPESARIDETDQLLSQVLWPK